MRKTDLEDQPVNKVLYNKHRRRKNHDKVAAMYAMYCLPKSLEQVGTTYRMSRQAVHDLFSSRGYVMRSKELKGLQVVDGVYFTLTTEDGYLRGTINKKRVMLQRYIWEKYRGPIPDGYWVMFRDGNKTNVALENLGLAKVTHLQKIKQTV